MVLQLAMHNIKYCEISMTNSLIKILEPNNQVVIYLSIQVGIIEYITIIFLSIIC